MATVKSTEAHGHWLPSGIRNVPRGRLTWGGVPRRAYTAMVGGKVVATVRPRGHGRGWVARIPGWIWEMSPIASSAAYFKRKESDVGVFPSAAAAKKAVEAAYKQLLDMER